MPWGDWVKWGGGVVGGIPCRNSTCKKISPIGKILSQVVISHFMTTTHGLKIYATTWGKYMLRLTVAQ